jgi:hypothetical protein
LAPPPKQLLPVLSRQVYGGDRPGLQEGPRNRSREHWYSPTTLTALYAAALTPCRAVCVVPSHSCSGIYASVPAEARAERSSGCCPRGMSTPPMQPLHACMLR